MSRTRLWGSEGFVRWLTRTLGPLTSLLIVLVLLFGSFVAGFLFALLFSLPEGDDTRTTSVPREVATRIRRMENDVATLRVTLQSKWDMHRKTTAMAAPPTQATCARLPRHVSKHRYLVIPADSSGNWKLDISDDGMWLTSLTTMLLGPNGENQVDVMSPWELPESASASPQLQHLRAYRNITVVDTFLGRTCELSKRSTFIWKRDVAAERNEEGRRFYHRVRPELMSDYIKWMHQVVGYELIIVRDWPEENYARTFLGRLSWLRNRMIIVGLRRAQDLTWSMINSQRAFQGVVSPAHMPPAADEEEARARAIERRVVLLPPMVEEPCTGPLSPTPPDHDKTICFAGTFPCEKDVDRIAKFEMIQEFRTIRERTEKRTSFLGLFSRVDPSCASPEFQDLLQDTEGLDYRVGDNNLVDILQVFRTRCDLCVEIVSGTTQDVRIVSVKMLNMASLGLPIVTNRIQPHIDLLGKNYSLYWDPGIPGEEFATIALKALGDDTIYTAASARVCEAANRFTPSRVYKMMLDITVQEDTIP